MAELVKSRLRGWGKSVGVVIPKEAILKEKLKAGDEVELLILRKPNVLTETFGTLKFKKSTADMLKEADEELWNE